MATNNGINSAGDVQIDEIIITSLGGKTINLIPQLAGIELYEDIFSPFITGKIYLVDSQEITSILPIVGNEILKIKFKTPTIDSKLSYNGEYYVYKMDDKVKVAERTATYALHFISTEGIIDVNKKVSKAFSGKISDIVKELVTSEVYGLESKKQCNIEETTNTTKYISNYWSPARNLAFVSENAISKEHSSPTFLFFENKNGFNFVSLAALYGDQPQYEFVWDNYSADVSNNSSSRDLNKDYQRVLELKTPDTFNYIDRVKSGMYGSELISYDLMTKQYMHAAYVPEFNEMPHLNKFPIWSSKTASKPRAAMVTKLKCYNNFDGYDDVTNVTTMQKRQAALTMATAFRVVITVFGRTDYTAAQKVSLKVPVNAQINKGDKPYDEVYTGNYMVAAICHHVDRNQHMCTMELVKDSLNINLDNAR